MLAVELVPKDIENLKTEAVACLKNFSSVEQINIPDIMRLPHRSYDVASALLALGIDAIPHLRTVDHTFDQLGAITQNLMSQGLKNILLVSGDPPKDNPNFVSSEVTPIMAVEFLKKNFPTLKVFGALDSYRSNIQDELTYCHAKLDAGFDGLFSQPFFSLPLLEFWLKALKGSHFYAGFSPITSEKSKKYWTSFNKVPLDNQFEWTLESSAEFTTQGLDLVQSYNQSAYLMPITVSAQEYLEKITPKKSI
jgi:methylenetetrahydrofolate reductase (NADPH)